MVTELMEYRPGKWVKVVDGHIVGRATPEELAAWREARAHEQDAQLSLPDLDVDLAPPAPASGPGRTLDVPLRPAFERRGRRAEEPPAPMGPARPAAAERHVPGAAQPARPQEPVAGPQPPAPPRPEDDLASLTIEVALARDASARRRQGLKPPADEEDGPRTVRRRLPTLGPAPIERPQARPATAEATPLPKKVELVPAGRPQAKPKDVEVTPLPKPEPARRRPAASTSIAPPRPQPEASLPIAAEDEPAPEEVPVEEARPPAGPGAMQGPRYWWIYNASRQPMEDFVKEWLPRYKAKFGHEASFVICHEDDLAAIQAVGLEVDVSPLLEPGHLYLGHHDGGDGGRKRASDSG